MIVRIHPDAEEELYQAARWYEDREPGVGIRLLAEFDIARQRVAERADRLPLLERLPCKTHASRPRCRDSYLDVRHVQFENKVDPQFCDRENGIGENQDDENNSR